MHVSVIICTWNRAAMLDQTLASLHALRVPEGVTWELLVVNNNCTDATDEIIARHEGRLPLRRFFEPKPGKSYAANLAIDQSRGDLLLWTDDDVLIDPEWLAEYVVAAKSDPQAKFFGGPVEPWFSIAPPEWIKRLQPEIAMAFATRNVPESRPIQPTESPYGVNMATRRDALDGVRFDVRVGPQKNTEIRGEDVLFIDQLKARGFSGRWVSTARLRHYIPPERLTLRYIQNFYAGLASTAERLEGERELPSLLGVPRWALKEYIVQSGVAALLSPVKNKVWLTAIRKAAWARGVMTESRRASKARCAVTGTNSSQLAIAGSPLAPAAGEKGRG